MTKTFADNRAQVIVAGAGPAGAATAYHLAKAGIEVIVLEKSAFPRDKVCGDGLTPMAVKEILKLGINPLQEDGWQVNYGLTVIGGGHKITLPWAEQASMPNYGLTRARKSLDQRLIEQAQNAGAKLVENATVTEVLRDKNGRICGVVATSRDLQTRQRQEVEYYGQYVVDCCGANAKLATKTGRLPLENRPIAVAARAYFHSPRGNETWMESHLELWDGKRGESNLLPGYGWIFPMGNGIVNVGLGSVSSGKQATKLPYRQIFQTWTANLPEEWGFNCENQIGVMRSAPLPMAFNRKPLYQDGLLLVGDAGGMISPFNGEGIGPAMFAGRHAAAAIVQAMGRQTLAQAELSLENYVRTVTDQLSGYYSLGRAFVKLIEKPQIMQACTRYGLDKPRLMRLVHKLLSDGFERQGGQLSDRILQLACKVAPKS